MEKISLKAVEIEINSHCNKKCSYCPNSVDSRIEQGQMEPEVYHEIIHQLQDIGFKGRISYDFYNEPLLCRNLTHFVEYTVKHLPKSEIHLYSNGSLLSVEKFRELKSAGVKKFVITKHEDYFEDSQRSDFIFDKTFEQLSDNEKKTVVYKKFGDLKLTNRGGVLEHIESQIRDIQTYPCFIPTFMFTVTVKGNVVPCFEDFYQNHSMGNITESHIRDIWFQPEYVKMRKALLMGQRSLYKACSTCSRTEVMPEGK